MALLTTLLMVAASILLSLPMYQSAEVRIFTEIPLYVYLYLDFFNLVVSLIKSVYKVEYLLEVYNEISI